MVTDFGFIEKRFEVMDDLLVISKLADTLHSLESAENETDIKKKLKYLAQAADLYVKVYRSVKDKNLFIGNKNSKSHRSIDTFASKIAKGAKEIQTMLKSFTSDVMKSQSDGTKQGYRDLTINWGKFIQSLNLETDLKGLYKTEGYLTTSNDTDVDYNMSPTDMRLRSGNLCLLVTGISRNNYTEMKSFSESVLFFVRSNKRFIDVIRGNIHDRNITEDTVEGYVKNLIDSIVQLKDNKHYFVNESIVKTTVYAMLFDILSLSKTLKKRVYYNNFNCDDLTYPYLASSDFIALLKDVCSLIELHFSDLDNYLSEYKEFAYTSVMERDDMPEKDLFKYKLNRLFNNIFVSYGTYKNLNEGNKLSPVLKETLFLQVESLLRNYYKHVAGSIDTPVNVISTENTLELYVLQEVLIDLHGGFLD